MIILYLFGMVWLAATLFVVIILYDRLKEKYKRYKCYRKLSKEINALCSEEKIRELHELLSPDKDNDYE